MNFNPNNHPLKDGERIRQAEDGDVFILTKPLRASSELAVVGAKAAEVGVVGDKIDDEVLFRLSTFLKEAAWAAGIAGIAGMSSEIASAILKLLTLFFS